MQNQTAVAMKPADWAKKLPRPAYKNLERVPSPDPWFSVYKVAPDTYAFYEDGQYEEAITYLVLGESRALLIDTGNGIGNMRALCRSFTDLPVTLVNTHCHIDHVGSNYLFDDIAAFDDEMGIVRRTSALGYLHEKAKTYIGEPYVIKPYPDYFDPDTFCIPPYRVTKWIKDGDRFDLGGRVVEVWHMPGHSPDSICLLDHKYRLLFVGDTFYTGSIYTWLAGGDINLMIKSFKKLISLIDKYDILMPSHNEPAIEKEILYTVLKAAEEVRDQTREPILLDNGRKKYDYGRFAFVTK